METPSRSGTHVGPPRGAKPRKKGSEPGLPPLIRPRSLSIDVPRLLRDIGDKLKNAPPLGTQKVASAE